MEYRHLTLEERTVIMIYVQTGQRVEAAARVLRRSAATIRRELARNPSPYEAVAAHARAAEVTRWRRRRKLDELCPSSSANWLSRRSSGIRCDSFHSPSPRGEGCAA